jgi:3D (Asp-Asp-Asp) domain-containing protein
MKKLILLLIVIAITGVFAKESIPKMNHNSNKGNAIRKLKQTRIRVVATYYNPVKSQCDLDPLTTASNDKINIKKLKAGKIRWIACSRNLLKRWGGDLKYGDKVYVVSKNKNIKGYWIVKDSMNKRYKNRIDFLCYDKIQGDLSNVRIYKV